jgi:Cdc6-like AAA superfamily ATPase
VISSLSHHSKLICLVLASKTFGLDKMQHSTMSIFEKYKEYVQSEPVSYRRFSELLKDLENTGLIISDTRSNGQKGYRSEFQLVVDPRIVGEMINKEWWEKHVVKIKTFFEEDTTGSKNDPYNKLYQALKKDASTQL